MKRRCWREGTRVMFSPSPISRALYSYPVPKTGTYGRVTSLPVPGGRKTCLPGPGGGLVYVDWDDGKVMGVAAGDVEPVGKTIKRPRKGQVNMEGARRRHR